MIRRPDPPQSTSGEPGLRLGERWNGLSKGGKWAVVIGVLFVVGIIGNAVNPSDRTTHTSSRSSQLSAFFVCEDFVKTRLKSPGSAVFRNPSDDDGEVRWFGAPPTWTVVSTVDSQNGFGALLRSTFSCKVTLGGDEKWHLVSLTVK